MMLAAPAPARLDPAIVAALSAAASNVDGASELLIASIGASDGDRRAALRVVGEPLAQARGGFELIARAAQDGRMGVPATAAAPARVAADLVAAACAVVAEDLASGAAPRTDLLVDDAMSGLLDRAIVKGLGPLVAALR